MERLISGRWLYTAWSELWFAGEAQAEAVEVEVDHRGSKQRQHLADEQAAYDGDTEGTPEFTSGSRTDREWQRAKHRCHGRHHNRAEAQQARLSHCVFWRFPTFALALQREIDHHDGILFDNTDQQDDANHRYDSELSIR